MVIYSAGEGQQALDALGPNDPVKNGLFTRVFVREMEKVGVTVEQVAKNVREKVYQQARSVGYEQVPAIYDQVVGNFYFHPATASSETRHEYDALQTQLKSKQLELEQLQKSIAAARQQQAQMEAQRSMLARKQDELNNAHLSIEDTRAHRDELDRREKMLLQKQEELNRLQSSLGASEHALAELEAKKQMLIARQHELKRFEESIRRQETDLNAAARQSKTPPEGVPHSPGMQPVIVPSF